MARSRVIKIAGFDTCFLSAPTSLDSECVWIATSERQWNVVWVVMAIPHWKLECCDKLVLACFCQCLCAGQGKPQLDAQGVNSSEGQVDEVPKPLPFEGLKVQVRLFVLTKGVIKRCHLQSKKFLMMSEVSCTSSKDVKSKAS